MRANGHTFKFADRASVFEGARPFRFSNKVPARLKARPFNL